MSESELAVLIGNPDNPVHQTVSLALKRGVELGLIQVLTIEED